MAKKKITSSTTEMLDASQQPTLPCYQSTCLPSQPRPTDIDGAIEDLVHALSEKHGKPMEASHFQVTHVVAGHLPESHPDRYKNILTLFVRQSEQQDTTVQPE